MEEEKKQNISHIQELEILITTVRVLVQRTKSQVGKLSDFLSEKQEHLQVLVSILRDHENNDNNLSENETKACAYLLTQLQVPLGSFADAEPPTPRSVKPPARAPRAST